MIHHHLNDEMILAYAAGSLPLGHALLVACHLEACPHCAARLAEAEAVGGAMVEWCEETSVSDDLYDRLLVDLEMDPGKDRVLAESKPRSLDGPGNMPGFGSQSVLMPSLLTSLIGDDFDAIRWRTAGPGVKQFVLPLEGTEGETVRLLKLSPGFVTPEHGHHGSELTMVLEGILLG